MGAQRKTLHVTVLALAMMFSLILGAVFPVPPLMVLARRRRTDPLELVLPASAATGLDLGKAEVPAALLVPSQG
ncbi:MAG: hypothetical protein WD178_06195 [Actinomycetota bacterium]